MLTPDSLQRGRPDRPHEADSGHGRRRRPRGVRRPGRLPGHRDAGPAAAPQLGRAAGGPGGLARRDGRRPRLRRPAGRRAGRLRATGRGRGCRRRRRQPGVGLRRAGRGVAAVGEPGAHRDRRLHQRPLPVPRPGRPRGRRRRGPAGVPARGRRRGHDAGRRVRGAVRRRARRRPRRPGGGVRADLDTGAARHDAGGRVAAGRRGPLRVHRLRGLQVAARGAGVGLLHGPARPARHAGATRPAGTRARTGGTASTAARCGSRPTRAASTSPPPGTPG